MALLQGASASASSTYSPSSSSSLPWLYQVFLSFRGEDTRNNFTAHLYHALNQKGINTYIDNNLERGEEISALFEAIEGSKISIIILSPHYASSTWCLKELVKILECKETKQQIVLPVFYHVDPSDVRHQRNTFEEAFAEHEGWFKDDKDKVQRWKAALTEVCNLSGFHLKKDGNESEFINEIIQWVDKSITSHTSLRVAKYPVGIQYRAQCIYSILCVGMNDIRMVGILGSGGIGKTTTAKAIYNLIADQFEATCFLPNVREISAGERGLVKLQEMLLSEILGGSNLKVDIDDRGINMIKERICRKKILLILDDVDQVKQLENLAGERDWFGSGSRIIITTRDLNVLTNHGVDFTYEVKELNWEESLQLFNWNAFKGDNPPSGEYRELTEQIIHYAGGLPLALQVLGSDLHGKSICEWRSALKDYKGSPHQDIQKVLRISYDRLGKNEKNIFLDIACFFKGEETKFVTEILDNCGFSANIGIRKLLDKCLITISATYQYPSKIIFEMHDLLQEMGREIVREESPEDPSGRSRLWFHEDVRTVLEENMGTNKIEAILVRLPKGHDSIQLSPKAFMEMKRLRLFINREACLSGKINSLPNELRVLDWFGYHLPFLPSNFHGKKLSYLRMNYSNMIRDVRVLEHMNLTVLNFSYSELLKKIPNLSGHSNLKELILSYCRNLEEIHDSLGLLEKLVVLNLFGCSKLRSFPRSIKLRSLEVLDVRLCSSLLNFPEIEGEMKNLREINLIGSRIKELPSSIVNISGLRSLIGSAKLMHLPGSIFQLQHLELVEIGGCPRFRGFGENSMEDNRQFMSSIVPNRKYEISGSPPNNSIISNSTWQPNLIKLDLSETGIVSVTASITRFVQLRRLALNNCKQLQEIQQLPQNIEVVYAKGCISLESFPQASKKFQFDTSDESLDKLIWLDLSGCHKLLKKLSNPVLSPSLRKDLFGPVYAGQEIPTTWFSLLEDYVLDGIADSRNGLPTWFSHSVNSLSANRCRISVNWQECLEETITIAFCAVIGFRELIQPTNTMIEAGNISAAAYVVREGRSPRHVKGTNVVIGDESMRWSQHLFLAYSKVEPSELEGNHLEVKFLASSLYDETKKIASCEVHRVHEHKERVEARKRKNEKKRRGRAKDGQGVLSWVTDVQMDVSNAEPENLLDLLSMIQLYQNSWGPSSFNWKYYWATNGSALANLSSSDVGPLTFWEIFSKFWGFRRVFSKFWNF